MNMSCIHVFSTLSSYKKTSSMMTMRGAYPSQLCRFRFSPCPHWSVLSSLGALYVIFQVSNGSVSSLMLTPLQARQLIEEANVIKVIVDTVMELLREHLDASNHFFFPGHSPDKFSRIQLIFNDLRSLIAKQVNPLYLLSWSNLKYDHFSLRYILISKPSVWSEELQTQFIEGFRTFLKLLKCMQVIMFLIIYYVMRCDTTTSHHGILTTSGLIPCFFCFSL